MRSRRGYFGAALAAGFAALLAGCNWSGGEPALQGYVEANYNIFYVGTWASNVDFGEEADVEIDLYAGIRPEFDRAAFDLGYAHYFYVNDTSPNYGAFVGSVEYYKFDTTNDFTAVIVKLKQEQPDILHHIAHTNDSILFWRQAKEQNLQTKAVVHAGATGYGAADFGKAHGNDANGVFALLEPRLQKELARMNAALTSMLPRVNTVLKTANQPEIVPSTDEIGAPAAGRGGRGGGAGD